MRSSSPEGVEALLFEAEGFELDEFGVGDEVGPLAGASFPVPLPEAEDEVDDPEDEDEDAGDVVELEVEVDSFVSVFPPSFVIGESSLPPDPGQKVTVYPAFSEEGHVYSTGCSLS